jgi:hypothetical protein
MDQDGVGGQKIDGLCQSLAVAIWRNHIGEVGGIQNDLQTRAA